jgi:hypothetical protein
LEIRIFDDKQALGVQAASQAAEQICSAQRERLNHKAGIVDYHLLSPEGDPAAECRRVGRLIQEAPIDVAFVGMVPASILRTHPRTTLFLDCESASLLEDSDFL